MKAALLNVLTADVKVGDMRLPLLTRFHQTLRLSVLSKRRNLIAYPSFPHAAPHQTIKATTSCG
jgi:hypothetical protein